MHNFLRLDCEKTLFLLWGISNLAFILANKIKDFGKKWNVNSVYFEGTVINSQQAFGKAIKLIIKFAFFEWFN